MVALNTEGSQVKTRQQLIEAAGQVFAEHGYRAATVREICLRAGANVASIHYHFGDKEKLYLEVLRYAHQKAMQTIPPMSKGDRTASPEQQLKDFVSAFLLRLLEPGSLSWDGKLIAREMVEPTAAMDGVVEERIRPLSKHVREIVVQFLGGNASEDAIRECEFSIVSQCLFYQQDRPVVTRLYPKLKLSRAEIDKLVNHITEFSLAGLKAKKQK